MTRSLQLVTEVLVGLDATIVASATAVVANEFHALQDLGFYGSSYLLTCCALQPLFGRAYAYFNKKYTFLFAIFLFELGSIISAVATTSRVFILGRAFQGSGYAGESSKHSFSAAQTSSDSLSSHRHLHRSSRNRIGFDPASHATLHHVAHGMLVRLWSCCWSSRWRGFDFSCFVEVS